MAHHKHGRMHEMHHSHHGEHGHHSESHASEHGMKGGYKHETDHPKMPHEGHMLSGWGMHDFKGEADPIAYGQAGTEGCRSDEKKMHSQFKDYHWD